MQEVRLKRFARARWLPPVPGQRDDERYACVSRGIPMPPGGLAYLVSSDGGRQVRIVAYIDRFGRAFAADAPLDMPPAEKPDLCFARYPEGGLRGGATGGVEIAVPRSKPLRVGEFSCSRRRYAITSSRVELGGAASDLDLAGACGVAYLAYCLFPQREGVSLSSSSVRSVLMRLRERDLFAALRNVYDEACRADSHPRVHAPGVVRYLARMLRDSGLAGITAKDVAPEPLELDVEFEEGEGAWGLLPPPDVASMLRAMLASAGIQGVEVLGAHAAGPAPDEPPLPEARLVRTVGYANTFYAGFDRAEVSPSGLERLYEAEGVLNRFLFMVESLDRDGLVQSASESRCAGLDLELVRRVGDRAFAFVDDASSDGAAAGESPQADPFDDSDLAVRISFARSAESLRLPYRLEYNMGFSAADGVLVVDATSPAPGVMPRFEAPAADGGPWRALPSSERNAFAAGYAAQVSAIVAAVGFAASRRVERVVANIWHIHSGVDERCILSVDYDRSAFLGELSQDGGRGRARLLEEPLAFVAGFSARFRAGEGGAPLETDPVMACPDVLPAQEEAEVQPDTDVRPLGPAASRELRARRISDLGIYEEAGRKRVAESIVEAFRKGGDLDAIAAARNAGDATEDVLVRDACRKVCDGISLGTLSAEKADQITSALTDVYGLQSGMRRASDLMRTDARAARSQLESIVASCELDGWFSDTPERCFRYFDSYAARAVYALRCAEHDAGARDLRLVADEYYLAHYRLSTLLSGSLEGCEAAIDHARRCVELAPSVANGYLRLARCYFAAFDYYSEIETLKEMLEIAWNPSDVAMALYWMGYAFWLLGDRRTGAACYQRCASFDRGLAEAAASEVAAFCERDGVERREIPEKEADELLGAAGVDLGKVQENVEFIVRAAAAAVDAGSYSLGRTLLGSATMYLRDDALSPVIESLRV